MGATTHPKGGLLNRYINSSWWRTGIILEQCKYTNIINNNQTIRRKTILNIIRFQR